jgi:hypothetical protein
MTELGLLAPVLHADPLSVASLGESPEDMEKALSKAREETRTKEELSRFTTSEGHLVAPLYVDHLVFGVCLLHSNMGLPHGLRHVRGTSRRPLVCHLIFGVCMLHLK